MRRYLEFNIERWLLSIEFADRLRRQWPLLSRP